MVKHLCIRCLSRHVRERGEGAAVPRNRRCCAAENVREDEAFECLVVRARFQKRLDAPRTIYQAIRIRPHRPRALPPHTDVVQHSINFDGIRTVSRFLRPGACVRRISPAAVPIDWFSA